MYQPDICLVPLTRNTRSTLRILFIIIGTEYLDLRTGIRIVGETETEDPYLIHITGYTETG